MDSVIKMRAPRKIDRLEAIENSLNADGFAPETLYSLELILAELQYLREQIEALKCSK